MDLVGESGPRGRYLVVDPPRRVVFTWGWETVNRTPGISEVAPDPLAGMLAANPTPWAGEPA